MEAYETPVMEVVEIEDEAVIVCSCPDGDGGDGMDSIIRREKSL